LEVSSSDFPQFGPNPNTGGSLADSIALRPASQTILHDAEHPSAMILPVIPLDVRGPGADIAPLK
jgi:uncharacterized protein